MISREELERYAQKNDAANEDDSLPTRLENNYLKTIGLLVRMYLEVNPDESFDHHTRPTVSHIVEHILQHMENHEIHIHGVGESTLNERIMKALDSLDIY